MKPLEIIEKLNKEGVVELKPQGNSMTPLIRSGQRVKVTRFSDKEILKVGDIVFVKVNGFYYIHLISSISGYRYQISNNHGHVNGWVTRNKIYGKASLC